MNDGQKSSENRLKLTFYLQMLVLTYFYDVLFLFIYAYPIIALCRKLLFLIKYKNINL